jgi:hypothetical protein
LSAFRTFIKSHHVLGISRNFIFQTPQSLTIFSSSFFSKSSIISSIAFTASHQDLSATFLAKITAITDQILVPEIQRMCQPFRRNSLIYQSCAIPLETPPLSEKNFHSQIASSEFFN